MVLLKRISVTILFLFVTLHLLSKEIFVNSLDVLKENSIIPDISLIISSPIDLKNSSIHLSEGTTIRIADGKLFNGTVFGNSTKLEVARNSCLGVIIRGRWIVPEITDLWFDDNYLDDNAMMSNINHLQSNEVDNSIHLFRNYEVNIDSTSHYAFVLSSNTSLHVHSTIKIKPNNYAKYGIVDITKRNNVSVDGGKIIGDVGKHGYIANSTSEWGMGINIVASQNVAIRNISISRCTGDGIYLGGLRETSISNFDNACKNIVIESVTCDNNRRQGMSIVHAKDVRVSRCVFSNTGQVEFVKPGHGVDIEPNVSKDRNMSVSDIYFMECVFTNNMSSDISTAHYYTTDSEANIKGIFIKNSEFSSDITIRSGSFVIDNSTLTRIRVDISSRDLSDIEVRNSIITGGLYLHSSVRDKDHPEYTGNLNNLVFMGCDFVNKTENKGKSILCLSGDISRVKNFVFDDCKFNDKSKVNKKVLNRERKGAYVFKNCTFKSEAKR